MPKAVERGILVPSPSYEKGAGHEPTIGLSRFVILLNRLRGGIMTRSCLWWLMRVAAVLPLIRVPPSFCQHTENRKLFLLAIKNNKSGLEVHTLFPENRGSIDDNKPSQWPDNKLEPQTLFIPGHSLSSECGDQYFQCQELLVINEYFFQVRNDNREFNIVFVPLENGILLLSYCYDSNNMTLERSIFTVNSSNCSPTVFYNINSKIYTLCISSYEEYVAVYEIQLNSVIKFEGASLIGPLTSISISNSLSSSNFSNFIIVGHMIFLTIGNTIIVLDVFDMTQTQQYPELSQCAQINKLVYTTGAGNQLQLVAYCTDGYIYFDPIYGDWTNKQLFSSNGVPYLCPGSNYRATLLTNGSLQLSLRDLLTNIINNVNISSGICFESQNRTYFAYSDQQHNNVYVYDFIRQNYFPVSPYDCTCQDCPQLLLLEKQYLVIRDANHNLVLDTTTNFSLIINISSGIADILAVLHSNVYSAITPSPPIISTLINSLDLTSVIRSTRPAPIIIHSTSAVAQVSPGNTLSTLFTTQEHTYAITASSLITVSGTTRKFSPGMNPGTTSTLASSQEYTYASANTPLAPLFPIHSAIIATISNSNNSTSIYSLIAFTTLLPNDNVTVIHTNIPTSVTTHNNSVGIILTVVIGLFVIIVILVAVAAGFSIQHWRRKW